MCMLCVIQKWSRRVATILPWLVIPLIGLWPLSHMLPPAFRFEITSSRLACVFVLLLTLFWYEVLMPRLSAWRVRRNARLRERKHLEAMELQKLKKTATRKCRNCLMPYRDQNPGGGKFTCTCCGHISKRPVLDFPSLPRGSGFPNFRFIKDLLGKGGKIFNRKAWLDNIPICNQEWLENENWTVNGSFPMMSKSDVGFFGGSEPCLMEKSYPGANFFAWKLLSFFTATIRWLWRKLSSISSLKEDFSDDDSRRMLTKNGENGSTGHESRGEKARRKAEEKRQARLEKEVLEEEERKQREEVARLVEERRRLRDEKIEAQNHAKRTSLLREKNNKKEAENKRQEKRKEKDKGSCKSSYDVEKLEKKVGKENERKRDTERKSETDQYGVNGNSASSFSRGNVGVKYFDRMRGTLVSSSKAFSGSGFFGKVAPTPVPSSSAIKPNCSVDNSLVSNSRRDFHPSERVPGKIVMNGVDKSYIHPTTSETQSKTAPKSWKQLFTRSPAPPPPSHLNIIGKSPVELQSSELPMLYDNPINFPSPFILPPISGRAVANSSNLPEEPELFEDPCYEPDPVSLLGPVSESLDNFQLDRGSHFCSSPKAHDMHIFPAADLNNVNDKGTWHMWNSSPLGLNGLSLVGGPANWVTPLDLSGMHHFPQKTMASLFAKDGHTGNAQNCSLFSSSIRSSNDQDLQPHEDLFPPVAGGESYIPSSPTPDTSQKKMVYESSSRAVANHAFDPSTTSRLSKNEWAAIQGSEDGVRNPSVTKSAVGGLYSPPDVQSLWLFE